MKSDHIKFSGSQQCEMNTKFGSYLQSTTSISLFCIPSNIESSGSWFDPYVSLFELLSQKSWSRRLKKSSQRIFQSSELTTDLALHSTSKIDFTILNGQIKLQTSPLCETHLPALDMINSR